METNQHHMTPLSIEDLSACVGGKIQPITIEPLMAEDMWGNKMSVEEWMDYMLYGVPNGADPHDFPGGRGK